jgi:hypothetical protein
MLVKAIAQGFDGMALRQPGDVFEFKGKLGKWMKPHSDDGEQEDAEESGAPEAPAKPKAKAKAKKAPAEKAVKDADVL